MKVLVTGARGYIGAHIVKMLKEGGHFVIATALPGTVGNDISAYADDSFGWDINHPLPENEIAKRTVDVIIHCAAQISVEESVKHPGAYYTTNIIGTLNVIRAFPACKMLFASTGAAFTPDSPYAKSKIAAEDIVKERCDAYTIFRFFNVAGSVGFKSYNEPTHLMRRAAMAARGEIPHIAIYGTDYDTKDGTCIRDYVHVQDIAAAICRAVTAPAAMTDYECLGSGKNYTVREVINTMQSIAPTPFKVVEQPKRPGDTPIATVPTLSSFITPTHTLKQMCEDTLTHL